MDQNFTQILPPREPGYTASGNYLDFAVTRNFSYPYSIQMLNDLSFDHLPMILRYEKYSCNLNLRPPLSTNWDQYFDAPKNFMLP